MWVCNPALVVQVVQVNTEDGSFLVLEFVVLVGGVTALVEAQDFHGDPHVAVGDLDPEGSTNHVVVIELVVGPHPVSYTHLTLPTTPYV